jgi:hypothetical protein
MNERIVVVLKGLGLTFLAAMLTWLLSWLMQYVATLITAGQEFHLNQATNRLAFVTVVVTVVLMLVLATAVELRGFANVIFFASFGLLFVSIIGWVANQAFPGTTISTVPAQWIYGVATALWSMLMWYVFLDDLVEDQPTNNQPRAN